MTSFASFIAGATAVALTSSFTGLPALAGAFVYVSNAEDGDIGTYRMQPNGQLEPGPRVPAAKLVMPMAVSPDKRFLYAASRSRPYSVYAYSIDASTGALHAVSVAPLAESFPFISLDKTGRFLFGASYGGHVVSVNAVGSDGRVSAEPLQVISLGRNAHSIRIDESNRFVYVPALGTDQIFQLLFDAHSGRLTSNTPAVVLMKPSTGPRHFVISPDNKYAYVLSEFLATVTTFSLDSKTGLLTESSSVSGLPPDSKLTPGGPRLPVGSANAPAPRNTENDIWAADIHMTPNGKFLYISERTSSILSVFSVEAQTGKLTYLNSTPTEKQPRGFAIDPAGKFLIASGEKSDTISVYTIDPSSGSLRLLQKYPAGKGANWVELVEIE
jgi:6-phosphogluconolactonase